MLSGYRKNVLGGCSMDEALWELFWTTGLPEAYALAKQAGDRPEQSEG